MYCRFFNKKQNPCFSLRPISQSALLREALSIEQKQIQNEVSLIKLDLKVENKMSKESIHQNVRSILQNIVKNNSNCLVMATAPSTSVDKTKLIPNYPGHNFIIAINETSEIECTMSKRPGNHCYEKLEPIPDPRFYGYKNSLKSFNPKFTNFEEELIIWYEKALELDNYPLFLHIFPFQSLNDIVTLKQLSANIEDIKNYNRQYTLFSHQHNSGDYYIRPENCNHAVFQAIFGHYSGCYALEQDDDYDLSTQETAQRIGTILCKNTKNYLKLCEIIGLSEAGIPPLKADFSLFAPSFTC